MEVVVVKFGGSLLTDINSLKKVGDFIEVIRKEYVHLVVVVSALKHTTDLLYKQAGEVAVDMGGESLDALLVTGEMISSALVAMCVRGGVAMNAYDAGIFAEGPYGDAQISSIETGKLIGVLERGEIPIVCGYQGVSEAGRLMTLGRGGSDYTAIALGAWLSAKGVIMYKDVPGVLRYPGAKDVLASLDYQALLELQAAFSCPLIQPKALQYAQDHKVVFRIKNPFSACDGTLCYDVPTSACLAKELVR